MYLPRSERTATASASGLGENGGVVEMQQIGISDDLLLFDSSHGQRALTLVFSIHRRAGEFKQEGKAPEHISFTQYVAQNEGHEKLV